MLLTDEGDTDGATILNATAVYIHECCHGLVDNACKKLRKKQLYYHAREFYILNAAMMMRAEMLICKDKNRRLPAQKMSFFAPLVEFRKTVIPRVVRSYCLHDAIICCDSWDEYGAVLAKLIPYADKLACSTMGAREIADHLCGGRLPMRLEFAARRRQARHAWVWTRGAATVIGLSLILGAGLAAALEAGRICV